MRCRPVLSRSVCARCGDLLLALLLAGSVAPAGAQAPPPTEEVAADAFVPLHSLITAALGPELGTDRGALLLIRDGQVLDEGYFGDYREDSVVPLGAASQWLTAAAILTLVDAGLFTLDEPIGTIAARAPAGPAIPRDKTAITFRQLLSHTSGLPAQHACLGQPELALETCAGRILAQPLRAAPGAQLRYGAASYQVAGYLAARVAGKSWDELFRDGLAVPLDFEHTSYGADTNPDLATSGRSSLGEYGRFLEMLLAGGRHQGQQVISPAVVAEMLRDQTSRAEIAYTPYDPSWHFALGAWVERRATGGQVLELSCPGRFGFVPWVDLERRLVGVLQLVARPEPAAALAGQVRAAAQGIADQLAPAP